MREAFAASGERLTVLSRLRALRGPRRAAPDPAALAVFATPSSLLQPVPAIEQYAASELVLVRGTRQPFQGLLERLRALDYDSEAVCEAPGHYAVRGGIIDVYPVTAPEPYRLDFFGDEIEDIRAFDPVTQRSGAQIERISVGASPAPAPRGREDRGLRLPQPPVPPRLRRARGAGGGIQGLRRLEAADGLAPLLAACAAAFGFSETRRGVGGLRGAGVGERVGHREPCGPQAASPGDATGRGQAAGRGGREAGLPPARWPTGAGRGSRSPWRPRRRARRSA